jgi:hypothetical protein
MNSQEEFGSGKRSMSSYTSLFIFLQSTFLFLHSQWRPFFKWGKREGIEAHSLFLFFMLKFKLQEIRIWNRGKI